MAKKVSTTVIGGFVVSAIALMVTAVIIFGSGSFWTRTKPFVLYFEESVKGLSVGSPVMFRGVQIGSVKSIILQAEHETHSVHIPVTIDINENKFQLPKGEKHNLNKHIKRLIELGLRAQLDLQSIVTNQCLIQLDFLPDTPAHLSGLDHGYPEIPTIRSTIDELTSTFKNLPIKKIAHNLYEISERINKLLHNEKIDHILDSIDSAATGAASLVADADTLVRKVDDKVEEALKLLKETMDSFTRTADSADRVLTEANQEIQPISDGLIKALDAVKKTLDQADTTLVTVDDFIAHSNTRAKLNRSLDEITSATRSLGELADYLERHPEALLKGKNGGGN